ncbi:DeoR/GlpR family DNA-binding transcription regulator [Halalkalibacter okhensis]|uniref:HTH deoR-type domain-containing protein n=1 Tax=Halalkalibacter okhensis TaxID=333138 RepID=A0A0B0IGD2_9BACI|nr:DeoR/GlpR family DNA-binding transcription regulator [Halalkalibacter okhensis]KHF41663.1 hypothetical protein LQ50_02895 [Halalkalibacter okhensis]
MGPVKTQEGLLAANRQKEIVKLTLQSQSVRVVHLSKLFGVTEETIRRDLEKLESEGQLKRIHGGAVPLNDGSMELPLIERTVQNINEKRLIGQKAAEFVVDGDIIALDSSTTCLELAKSLDNQSIHVFTNGLPVVMELGNKTSMKVLCTGGFFDEDHHAFFGQVAERSMEGHHIDKLFLSCKGYHVDWGMSESHEQQAMLKRKLLLVADEVNLLIDSSKINVKALINTAPSDRITRIFTDKGALAADINLIEKRGIEVVICN